MWDADGGGGGEASVLLRGHAAPVTGVAWDPRGGGRLATASLDRTAAVWDVTAAARVGTLRGHGAGTSSVAWSPDGGRLATACGDGAARVWDTGLALGDGGGDGGPAGHAGEVVGVTWSPDGAQVATASLDGTARVGRLRRVGRGGGAGGTHWGRDRRGVERRPYGRRLATA